MCVIAIADNHKRPSRKMVEQMFEKNNHGAGAAWREKDENGKVWVHWEKGLDKEAMIKLVATVPLPAVFHFRLASLNGGDKRPELCHPFEVSLTTPPTLKGKTDGEVLFHNGDYGGWSLDVKQAAYAARVKLPKGKLSDTRAMAFISAVLGTEFMDLAGQKGVAFGPETYEVFWGSDGWKNIGGILCSNDKFVTYATYNHSHNHNNDHRGTGSTQNPTICRARGCGVSVGATDYCYCEKHKHMRPSPRLLSPAQENRHEICMECSSFIKDGHKDDCSKSEKKLGGKVGKIVCQVCKETLEVGRPFCGHKADCSVRSYGMVVAMGPKSTGTTGGVSVPDPFQVVLLMEEAYKAGKFGRKAFKKIAERWGFGNGQWQVEKELRTKKLPITH